MTSIPCLPIARLPHINTALWDRSPCFSQVSINVHTTISEHKAQNKDSFPLEVKFSKDFLGFQDIKTGKETTNGLLIHLPLAAMA